MVELKIELGFQLTIFDGHAHVGVRPLAPRENVNFATEYIFTDLRLVEVVALLLLGLGIGILPRT